MVRSSKQPVLRYISSLQTTEVQKHFLPAAVFDYFSTVLELTHTTAHR